MAGELKASLVVVRSTLDGITGIRKGFVSEPAAVNNPPAYYIAGITGDLTAVTLGNTSHSDFHTATIRLVLSRADGDRTEEEAFNYVDAMIAAFRANRKLTNTARYAAPAKYALGYLDIGSPSTRYRVIEMEIPIQIDKT
jgi:hypothetical protein